MTELNIEKIKLQEDEYYRTIISLKKEDKLFLIENKISLTKLVREVIRSLREKEKMREKKKEMGQ